MSSNMQQCWDWLHDRKNHATVTIDYEKGGVYKRHRAVWHVEEYGWVDATGQSLEEAVMNAINTQIDRENFQHFIPGSDPAEAGV